METTTFEVLADPTRRRIIDLLAKREYSVGELVEQLGLSQPSVSKHLRVLREAGLVEVRRDAQRHWYQLRAEPLAEIDVWLAPYRRFWEHRLYGLEVYLNKERVLMDGAVQQFADKYVVRFERRLNSSVEEVWAALTQPEKISEWLAQASIELAEGGRIELRFDNTATVMLGTVTQIKRPVLFEYTWNTQPTPESLVRWELQPADNGCLLVLTHTLSTPEGLPAMLAGWHTHLDLLSQVLAGQKVEWPWSRWEELRDRYAQKIS